MTNRDYLMKLDNEKLAELIWSKKEGINKKKGGFC